MTAPACFWIDHKHVYLRTTWSQWNPVSLDEPAHVVALCNAPYCQLVVCEKRRVTAPVYHIAALPEGLFSTENDSENAENTDLLARCLETPIMPLSTFDECVKKIKLSAIEVSELLPEDLQVIIGVQFADDVAPVVITTDSHTLLLELLPDTRNYVFVPQKEEWDTYTLPDASETIVSLNFVDRLRRMKKHLANNAPEAKIDIGFLSGSFATDRLRQVLPSEQTEIKLVTYDTLEEFLLKIF